jgi:hypothetical protein
LVPRGQTPQTDPALGTAGLALRDFFMTGYMGIFVAHPLVAPSNVPNTIDLNIFVAGAEDFELAYIGGNNMTLQPSRFVSGTPTLFEEESLEAKLTARHAANLKAIVESDENEAQGECLPVGPVKVGKMYPSGLDSITHLKDIMKRYHIMTTQVMNMNQQKMMPFSVTNLLAGFDRNTGAVVPTIIPNGISYWTACFRSHIGGLRFKFEPYAQTTTDGLDNPTALGRFAIAYSVEPLSAAATTWNASVGELSFGNSTNINALFWQGTGAAMFQSNSTPNTWVPQWRGPVDWSIPAAPICEFEIPWERQFTQTLNVIGSAEYTDWYGNSRPSQFTEFTNACQRGYIYVASDGLITGNTLIYFQCSMSVADDFRMGGFLGPQPLYTLSQGTSGIATLYVRSPRFTDDWVVGVPR